MITIGSDHPVTRLARCDQTCRDGFLSDVQVHETADLTRLVKLRAAFLHAADQYHLMIQIK